LEKSGKGFGGGRSFERLTEKPIEQFTQNAAASIGQKSSLLDPETLLAGKKLAQSKYDNFAAKADINADKKLQAEFSGILKRLSDLKLFDIQKSVEGLMDRILIGFETKNRGPAKMEGETFKTLTGSESDLAYLKSHSDTKMWAGLVENALKSALDRTAKLKKNPEIKQAYKDFEDADRLYFNYKILARAMADRTGLASRGLLEPQRLHSILTGNKVGQELYSTGKGDLNELTRDTLKVMDKKPEGGIFEHIPYAVRGGAIGSMFGHPALGAAIGGQGVIGRIMNSDPAQRFIKSGASVPPRGALDWYEQAIKAGRGGLAAGLPGQTDGIPGYAEGGIATEPQLAMVGEKEPEAIIPLSKLPKLAGDVVKPNLLGLPKTFSPSMRLGTDPPHVNKSHPLPPVPANDDVYPIPLVDPRKLSSLSPAEIAAFRMRQAVKPSGGRQDSGLAEGFQEAVIPGLSAAKSFHAGDYPNAAAQALTAAMPLLGKAMQGAGPLMRYGAPAAGGAGITAGVTAMTDTAEAGEEGLTPLQKQMIARTPKGEPRTKLIQQFATEAAAEKQREQEAAQKKEAEATRSAEAKAKLDKELSGLPANEQLIYQGMNPQQRVDFWAQKAEVQRQAKAAQEAEEDEKRRGELPFRERFPGLMKWMPTIAAAMSGSVPAVTAFRRAGKANKYNREWTKAADDFENAVAAKDLDAMLASKNTLEKYTAEHAKKLKKIGEGPGVGSTLVGASAPFDLEFLMPNAVDAAMLPSGSPGSEQAKAALTNPSEWGNRAITGFAQGLVPSMIAGKYAPRPSVLSPTARSAAAPGTYDTMVRQAQEATQNTVDKQVEEVLAAKRAATNAKRAAGRAAKTKKKKTPKVYEE
jgi:hypothetical protein